MPLMATRIIRLRPAVLPAFAALATAIGQGCVKFYRLSENTYLLHAIGPSYPSLDSDWLLGTADAFPAFSALVRLSFHLAGEVGLVLLTIGISFIGFLAIAALSFVILSDLHDEVQLRWLVSAVVLTAGFLPPFMRHFAPHWLRYVSTFQGLGEQQVLEFPGILLPSDMGVLLLGSAALVVLAVRTSCVWLWLGSAGLAVAACTFHASYLAPLGVALIAMAVADMVTGAGRVRLFGYLATGVCAVGALLITNPVALAATNGVAEAQDYLSFQRIPHHTLISEWEIVSTLMICVIVVLGALLSKQLLHSWWLAVAMVVSLAMSLVAAATVQLTRSAAIASVFPWRISVILVPVAFTIILSYLGLRLACAVPMAQSALKAFTVLGAFAAICFGVYTTSAEMSGGDSPLVEALRAAPPRGTGLIPIALMDVRLNARVPVFVDWKSHPYRADEFSEWARRVALSRLAEAKPETACGLVDRESLDWAVMRRGFVPDCFSSWSQRPIGEYTLLIRPTVTDEAE